MKFSLVNDLIGVLGFGAFVWGAWGYDPRIAGLTAGIILLTIAYKGARK